MTYLVQNDLMISINCFKQEVYYTIYVSSFTDIRDMNWILGDRLPTTRKTQVIDSEGSTPIYMVRMMYPEKYFVQLQLRMDLIQSKFMGLDIVEYLMTEATNFGFFESQDAYYREIEMRKFFADMIIVTGAIMGAIAIMIINSPRKDNELSRLESLDTDPEMSSDTVIARNNP